MIATSSLGYRYKQGTSLLFPDVSIAQGQVMLLLGASGCGKSTWLALAAGLLQPTQGDMQVAGQSIRGLSPLKGDAWRARTIGLLPQKLHLSDALTIYQNLALVYFASGVPENKAAILAAIKSLGLEHLAQQKPSQLSGGQAQRVALARAVLLQPKVLLADEPTASLDDANAQSAVALLQDTATRCGATLVIATHDARVKQALPLASCLALKMAIRPSHHDEL